MSLNIRGTFFPEGAVCASPPISETFNSLDSVAAAQTKCATECPVLVECGKAAGKNALKLAKVGITEGVIAGVPYSLRDTEPLVLPDCDEIPDEPHAALATIRQCTALNDMRGLRLSNDQLTQLGDIRRDYDRKYDDTALQTLGSPLKDQAWNMVFHGLRVYPQLGMPYIHHRSSEVPALADVYFNDLLELRKLGIREQLPRAGIKLSPRDFISLTNELRHDADVPLPLLPRIISGDFSHPSAGLAEYRSRLSLFRKQYEDTGLPDSLIQRACALAGNGCEKELKRYMANFTTARAFALPRQYADSVFAVVACRPAQVSRASLSGVHNSLLYMSNLFGVNGQLDMAYSLFNNLPPGQAEIVSYAVGLAWLAGDYASVDKQQLARVYGIAPTQFHTLLLSPETAGEQAR